AASQAFCHALARSLYCLMCSNSASIQGCRIGKFLSKPITHRFPGFRFKRGRSCVICVNRITHQIISNKRKNGSGGASVGDNSFLLLMQQDVEWFLSRQQDAACIGLTSSYPNG